MLYNSESDGFVLAETTNAALLTSAIRYCSGISPMNALSIETFWIQELAVRDYLSMFNGIMCRAFHSQNISVKKKRRSFSSTWVTKVTSKFWYVLCYLLTGQKKKSVCCTCKFNVHVCTINQHFNRIEQVSMVSSL